MSTAQAIEMRRVDQISQGKLGIWLVLLMDGLSFATILIKRIPRSLLRGRC